MREKSHRRLGEYLVRHYMPNTSKRYINAFLLGCVEPDKNPATYLKGSIRCQWLRGHNYRNAQRLMSHISRRLERKPSLNLLDYYRLGKLIHYTTDAFTYAHNHTFPTNLAEHRMYEAQLQEHFLEYLSGDPLLDIKFTKNVMEAIRSYHREYIGLPADIRNDAKFALTACCCVLAILLTPRIL